MKPPETPYLESTLPKLLRIGNSNVLVFHDVDETLRLVRKVHREKIRKVSGPLFFLEVSGLKNLSLFLRDSSLLGVEYGFHPYLKSG